MSIAAVFSKTKPNLTIFFVASVYTRVCDKYYIHKKNSHKRVLLYNVKNEDTQKLQVVTSTEKQKV